MKKDFEKIWIGTKVIGQKGNFDFVKSLKTKLSI